MKRIVCLIVCFIALWGNSTTVSASKNECSHNYNATYDGHSFVCDICSWCGYENLHKSDCHQSFVTRIDNVVSRTGPRKSAKIVNFKAFCLCI
ncbi:MAG: hypothetical protein IKT93_03410 [Clostridia bacterium]|nr:hypothetical protein [Clostridia bacterium]